MAQGILVALEGIDGSGTTTQLGRLEAHLRAKGRDVHATAEPSGGEIGRMIRRVLRGELAIDDTALALLYAADRIDHLKSEIEPALARGAVVLTDRYVLSSLAYQSLAQPRAWVAEINAKARLPDATLFLRVGSATAAARRAARGGMAERFDATETQERIAASYEEALRLPVTGDLVVVDAERAADAVFGDCARAIEARLP